MLKRFRSLLPEGAKPVFPSVPQDLLEELERRYPATFPVDPVIMDAPADALKVAMARALGRRDVVNLLKASREAAQGDLPKAADTESKTAVAL